MSDRCRMTEGQQRRRHVFFPQSRRLLPRYLTFLLGMDGGFCLEVAAAAGILFDGLWRMSQIPTSLPRHLDHLAPYVRPLLCSSPTAIACRRRARAFPVNRCIYSSQYAAESLCTRLFMTLRSWNVHPDPWVERDVQGARPA